jgi:hypothetical protein
MYGRISRRGTQIAKGDPHEVEKRQMDLGQSVIMVTHPYSPGTVGGCSAMLSNVKWTNVKWTNVKWTNVKWT